MAITMSTTVQIIPIMSLSVSLVFGSLIDVPENRVALVGESIQFLCSTDQIYSINWQHIPFGSKYVEDIYISRTVVRPYTERFEVKRRELGSGVTEYSLVISAVQKTDAGTYRCHDEAGQGQSEDAQLTVLESPPKCSSNFHEGGFIGENDCDIQPEVINCSCSLHYIGNLAPEMNWMTSNGNHMKPTSQGIITDNSISYELHINATITINNLSIIWYPRNFIQNNWTSNQIQIQFVKANLSILVIEHKDNLVCSANSNMACSYRWYARNASKSEWEVFEGQNLMEYDPGLFRCEAVCPLGHTKCIVTSLHVEYRPKASETASDYWSGFSSGIVTTSVVMVILVISIYLVLIKRGQKKKKRQTQHFPRKTDATE